MDRFDEFMAKAAEEANAKVDYDTMYTAVLKKKAARKVKLRSNIIKYGSVAAVFIVGIGIGGTWLLSSGAQKSAEDMASMMESVIGSELYSNDMAEAEAPQASEPEGAFDEDLREWPAEEVPAESAEVVMPSEEPDSAMGDDVEASEPEAGEAYPIETEPPKAEEDGSANGIAGSDSTPSIEPENDIRWFEGEILLPYPAQGDVQVLGMAPFTAKVMGIGEEYVKIYCNDIQRMYPDGSLEGRDGKWEYTCMGYVISIEFAEDVMTVTVEEK